MIQKLLMVSLWLFLLGVPLAAQSPDPRPRHAHPPPSGPRQPITRPDLLYAVETSREIVHRVIVGSDLAAAFAHAPKGKTPGEYTISLRDCRIDGGVKAQNLTAANGLIAYTCQFNGHIALQKIPSMKQVWLRASTLAEGMEMMDCKLLGLDLDGSTLNDSLTLTRVQSDGAMRLRGVQTAKLANITLYNCVFQEAFWGGEVERVLRGVVQLSHCRFLKQAEFDKIRLLNAALFDDCTFEGNVSFHAAHLEMGQDAAGFCLFSECRFGQDARFNAITLGSQVLGFEKCAFAGNFVMTNTQGDMGKPFGDSFVYPSTVAISSSSFAQRAYFDDVHVGRLYISTLPGSDTLSGQIEDRIETPTTFAKQVTFRRLECASADFTETEFGSFVDFNRAQFARRASFNNVVFNGDVSFSDVLFPSSPPLGTTGEGSGDDKAPPGLWMDDTQFAKTVRLSWRRLSEPAPLWAVFAEPRARLVTSDPATWDTLQQAFKRSENLEGQNEAGYQKRKLSGQLGNATPATRDDDSPAWNTTQRWFWGYGVRPSRVFAWMLLLFTGCTLLYRLLSGRATQPALNFDSQEIFRPQLLAERWVMQSDPLSAFLWGSASPSTQQQLLRYADPGFSMEELKAALLAVLNERLLDPNLERFRYCHQRGSDTDDRPPACKQRGYWMAACNRRCLLDAYRECLDSRENGSPLRNALRFSWRTCFSIDYGFKNARNVSTKVVAAFQSVAFKFLLFFWVTSLSNTTPLLKDLVSKLIPT